MLTTEQATVESLDMARAGLRAIREREGKPLCAVFKWGGFGDFYQQMALAVAALRHHDFGVHMVIITSIHGAKADIDLAAGVSSLPAIDVGLMPPCDMWRTLEMLREQCEIVYHMPGYAVRTHIQKGFNDAEQKRANLCLEPYKSLYFDWPKSNQQLCHVSQWDVMSDTVGFRVEPTDFFVSERLAEIGDEHMSMGMLRDEAVRSAERGALHGVGKYVVVHNTGGGGSVTKHIPDDVFQAGIDTISALGYRVVQVGAKSEKKYKRVIDRRGLRWPLSVRLMNGADAYFGLEGAMAYVAFACGTRSLVAYGSTPEGVFAFPGSIALNAQPCRACWWATDDWSSKCAEGHASCANMPSAAAISAAIERALPDVGKKRRRA